MQTIAKPVPQPTTVVAISVTTRAVKPNIFHFLLSSFFLTISGQVCFSFPVLYYNIPNLAIPLQISSFFLMYANFFDVQQLSGVSSLIYNKISKGPGSQSQPAYRKKQA